MWPLILQFHLDVKKDGLTTGQGQATGPPFLPVGLECMMRARYLILDLRRAGIDFLWHHQLFCEVADER